MNCPNCNAEIVYEGATFCPKCGKSLEADTDIPNNSIEIPQKRTDLILAGAILTIISAVFVASMGYIGAYQYLALVEYYGSTMASEFLGFLIFGIIDIIFALLAMIGGVFILKRKRLKISILGIIFLLASVITTYMIITLYQYGFTDILLFSEVSIFIMSILSVALIFSSKAEFT